MWKLKRIRLETHPSAMPLWVKSLRDVTIPPPFEPLDAKNTIMLRRIRCWHRYGQQPEEYVVQVF